MVLNIISTVNGMENEGMRNIASHMIHELKSMCTVRCSPLASPVECVKNTFGADAVLIFARASVKVAWLAKVLRSICKKVYIVLVQKPEKAFISKMGRSLCKCSYFTILPDDGADLRHLGASVYNISVGISREKFHPAVSRDEVELLRRKYGFSCDVPLVVHVGHLSRGRGLEEFLRLPDEKYQRLIVASGMFGNDEVEEKLRKDGVRIIKEYLHDISEVYRMADVYLFPTKSAEFVISIPLSVMESLACGTPAAVFDGVGGLKAICAADGAVITVEKGDVLETAIDGAVQQFKNNYSDLLMGIGEWVDVAASLLYIVSK